MSSPGPIDDESLDRLLDGAPNPNAGNAAAEDLWRLVGGERHDLPMGSTQALAPEDFETAGFHVTGLLGSGAHSTVFEAEDRALGRRVALKVVRGQGPESAAQRTFLREARTLARIDHPNVVRIWSAERREERLVMALERIDGCTLRERMLREGPMQVSQAARVALDIARGLCAVHAAGILHRDLHPGNVMLRANGRAVLLDFSVARLEGAQRLQRGGTIGSPLFEAPEVMRGESPSEASDVYALGVLTLWMCTGRSALKGSSWSELESSAIHGDRWTIAQIAPRMPRRLRRVIERAIDADPRRRTPDARALARELQAALALPRRVAVAVLACLTVGGAVLALVRLREDARAALDALDQRASLHDLGKAARSEMGLLSEPPALVGLEDLELPTDVIARIAEFGGTHWRVPEDHADPQKALDACADGDVVLLGPGKWDPLRIQGRGRSIALVGRDGAASTILDASGEDVPALLVCFDVSLDQVARPRVLVRGLTLTGGRGYSNPNSAKYADTDWYGGGLAIWSSDLPVEASIEGCALWDNGRPSTSFGTTFGGGAVVKDNLDVPVTFYRCLIARNAAWACGGGLMLDKSSRVIVEQCTIADNFAGAFPSIRGGIGLANGSHVSVRASVLQGNRGAPIGGYEGHSEGVDWDEEDSLVAGSSATNLGDDSPFRNDWFGGDYRLRAPPSELAKDLTDPLGAWASVPAEPMPSAVGRRIHWPERLGTVPRGARGLGARVLDPLAHEGDVLHVPSQENPTIQDALDASSSGDLVLLAPGEYHEALRFPNHPLEIAGEFGAEATLIDARRLDAPVIDVAGPTGDSKRYRLVVRGVTLRGGLGRLVDGMRRCGGALAISGDVDIELLGCVLWESGREQDTHYGGALWVGPGARVRLSDVLVARARARKSGAAVRVEGGYLEMEHVTLCGDDLTLLSFDEAARLSVRCCVLWNLGAAVDPDSPAGALDLAESIVSGGFEGSDVFDEDPRFADPDGADWRRMVDSDAVSADWGYRQP